MKNAVIRDRELGEHKAPYFVAELGTCHGGKLDVALRLATAAAEAGADCVKTETFQRELLVFDPAMTFSYYIRGEKITENLLEHMKRTELTYEEHETIKKKCDNLDVAFMSTAHDFASVDFLVDIGASAIKIASPDIVHYPLLTYVAKTGIPVCVDTGGSADHEIVRARQELIRAGAKDIIFNFHPGGHPTPAGDYNLNTIEHFKSMLGTPIGVSDHYDGNEMVYASAALGVDLIEKPISLNRFERHIEHIYSIDTKKLSDVIKSIRNIHNALGSPDKRKVHISDNRMSLLARSDLDKGIELSLDNTMFGRPNRGVPVEDWDEVKGRPLRRSVAKGSFITWDDV